MPNDTRTAPRTGGLRVLVLDDLADNADSLAHLLRFWGHEPVVAYEGPTALQLARVKRPDVALLDLAVSGMDGFEVARQLRQMSESKDVVLFALTGHGGSEMQRRAPDLWLCPVSAQAGRTEPTSEVVGPVAVAVDSGVASSKEGPPDEQGSDSQTPRVGPT